MSTGYLYFTGVLFKPSNEHPGILFYVGVLPGLPRVLKTDGSWLTLYCSRVTYRFYSVQCQTILLCPMPDDFTLSNARRFYSSQGDLLGRKGLLGSYIVGECVEKLGLCICNKLGGDFKNI